MVKRPFVQTFLISLGAGAALSLISCFVLFKPAALQGWSDGFFLGGLLTLLWGLLRFVGASGLFDRAGYSFKLFFRLYKKTPGEPQSFEEYQQKHKKQKPTWAVPLAGAALLLAALLLALGA